MVAASSALAVVDNEGHGLQTAFEPRTFDELVRTCATLFASGLLPSAIKKAEAAVFIGLRGRELGLSLGQSFASIFIIDGKTVLSGDLIAARVRRSSVCETWQLKAFSNDACTIVAQRKEKGSLPVELTYSLKDAERAGLLSKQNWRQYPRAMLRARCAAELARAVFPEVALGMYDPDELEPANDNGRRLPGPVYEVVPPRYESPVAQAIEPPAVEPAEPAVPPRMARKASEVAKEYAERMRVAPTRPDLEAIWAEAQKLPFKPATMGALHIEYEQAVDEIRQAEA